MAGPIGRPAQLEVTSTLEHAIEDSFGEVGIVQHAALGAEGLVGEDHGAVMQVAVVDDLKEDVCGIRPIAEVADFVDDEHVGMRVAGRELPAVVQCFRDDFDACIAHLRFPLRHRRVIRTTNLYLGGRSGKNRSLPRSDHAGERDRREGMFRQEGLRPVYAPRMETEAGMTLRRLTRSRGGRSRRTSARTLASAPRSN